MDKDRMVQVAQGVAEIYRIAHEYGLVVEMEECSASDDSWFVVYASDVENLVGVVDVVHDTFGEVI